MKIKLILILLLCVCYVGCDKDGVKSLPILEPADEVSTTRKLGKPLLIDPTSTTIKAKFSITMTEANFDKRAINVVGREKGLSDWENCFCFQVSDIADISKFSDDFGIESKPQNVYVISLVINDLVPNTTYQCRYAITEYCVGDGECSEIDESKWSEIAENTTLP